MRINTNVAALNSYNQLKNTQNNLSKSLSRLSSGKRVNGAADDAAGLAISEKMNSQTRGLAQAQRNAQDGISMIQTAEGALKETHSILQRMRELSVQSANDTNTEADRTEIQKEVDQLAGELSRISNTTEFNTQTLLNGAINEGSEGEAVFQIGSNSGQNLSVGLSAMDASSLGLTEDVASVSASVESNDSGNTGSILGADIEGTQYLEEGNYSVEVKDNASSGVDISLIDSNGETVASNTGYTAAAGPVTLDTVGDGSGEKVATLSYDVAMADGDKSTLTIGASGADLKETQDSGNTGTADAVEMDSTDLLEDGSYTLEFTNDGVNDNISLLDSTGKEIGSASGVTLSGNANYTVDLDDGSGSVTLTNGDVALANGDKIAFDVTQSDYESGTSEAATDSNGDGKIDTDAKVAKGIDVRTQENADKAISILDEAIAKTSAERSKLGALQNRLDHTINNLNTAEENLTAAESRISDVDMAKEMMNMSKQQILSQAGTAMMAQANQLPQGVLQLLG